MYAVLSAAQYGVGEIIMANLPWILMLILGFVLVAVEMFIPGFGLPGISGIILLVGGVIMISNGDPVRGLIVTVIIVALLCVMLSISIRSASKGRFKKSALVLNDVFEPEVSEKDMSFYVGKQGATLTVLRPAGMGEFDGVKLNIVSDGEYIGLGEKVKVERVEGNKIIVRKADGRA